MEDENNGSESTTPFSNSFLSVDSYLMDMFNIGAKADQLELKTL